jgi:hypothetical protein
MWLPTYLSTERHLSVAGTASYLLVLISGCFASYLSSAWLSDAIGRRRCFALFAGDGMTELLGFPLGFFNSGIFSGAYLTELYPAAVRGSGQGFSYSFGRALAAGNPAYPEAAVRESDLNSSPCRAARQCKISKSCLSQTENGRFEAGSSPRSVTGFGR